MAVFPVHYCGSIGYYQALYAADEVVFEQHEHFVKQTHRNRMEILGPNGIQKLVIPTVKTGQRRPMHEVEMSYAENWQKEHWKSLEAAYRRSPYFEYYEDELKPFFQTESQGLIEHCLDLTDAVLRILKMDLSYSLTSEYEKKVELDFRMTAFNSIVSEPYIQVFSDRHAFEPNLSILDALFCAGPKTSELILS